MLIKSPNGFCCKLSSIKNCNACNFKSKSNALYETAEDDEVDEVEDVDDVDDEVEDVDDEVEDVEEVDENVVEEDEAEDGAEDAKEGNGRDEDGLIACAKGPIHACSLKKK